MIDTHTIPKLRELKAELEEIRELAVKAVAVADAQYGDPDRADAALGSLRVIDMRLRYAADRLERHVAAAVKDFGRVHGGGDNANLRQ